MALFGLFKKKGRDATDTIDLTRMQSVRNKIAADAAASASTDTSSMGSMDLPMSMGTLDSSTTSTASSAPSFSAAPTEDRTSSKISMLMMRLDLLEHKVDRLERKTGIKSEDATY